MENIILRQSSSLGGRTSPVTELMPSDSLEYNTIDEKMCQSHGYNSLDGHDVICFDHTAPRSKPQESATVRVCPIDEPHSFQGRCSVL